MALGLTSAASATETANHKKMLGSGLSLSELASHMH